MASSNINDGKALEKPALWEAFLEQGVEAQGAARRGEQEHQLKDDEDAVQADLHASSGKGHREQDIQVVEDTEGSRKPDETSEEKREADGDFAVGDEMSKQLRVRSDKVQDEVTMKGQRIGGGACDLPGELFAAQESRG